MSIKYFTLYGERCSGTNFLHHSIEENFNLKHTTEFGPKHFFGYYDFQHNYKEDETLFICIIRNPITWINSFYKEKHHIPNENRHDINSFLFNTFYSIYDNGTEIIEDRNIITKERYKNIFEMRKVKNDFLINTIKNNVKNYILIRYEDLRDNYNIVLTYISNKFNLSKIHKSFKKIESYKGYNNKKYYKKNLLLKDYIINIIKNNLDNEQEKSLGYIL